MGDGKDASIVECFRELEGPEIARRKRYQLLDSITIAIRAVIRGAVSWVYVEKSGKSKKEWFRPFPTESQLGQTARNLVNRESSLKVGIQGKRLQAGWLEDYLLKVLLSQRAIAL